jgi:hypothetical protein
MITSLTHSSPRIPEHNAFDRRPFVCRPIGHNRPTVEEAVMTANTLSRIAALAVVLLSLCIPAAANDEYFVNEDDARSLAAVSFLLHVAEENPFLAELGEATLGSPVLIDDPETGPLFWEFPAERDGEAIGRLLIPADRRVGTTDFLIERNYGWVPWDRAFERAVESLQEEYGEIEVLDARPLMAAFPDLAVEIRFLVEGSNRPLTAYRDRWTSATVDPSQLRPFFSGLPPQDLENRMEKWNGEKQDKVDFRAALDEHAIHPDIVFEHPYSQQEKDVAREAAEAVYGSGPTLKTVDLSNLVLIPAELSSRSREATLQMVFAEDHGWTTFPYAPRSQQIIGQELRWYYGDDTDPVGALKTYLRTFPWSFAKSDYIANSEANLKAEIDAGRLFIDCYSLRKARMIVAYQVDASGKTVSAGYYDPLPYAYGSIGFYKAFSAGTAYVMSNSYLTVKK